MKRTQMYLDDDLWEILHAEARRRKTTVSDLVRGALRERFPVNVEKRKRAMQAFVGIWKDRKDMADPEAYIRSLRRGPRMKRLGLE